MAFSGVDYDPKYLRAIVDMGSNGIRFSISSLQPPTARIMPTLYQNRAGISLYDAQYNSSGERQPIDDETIKAVITAFKQFKQTCEDFQVLAENITVLATEATRTATNSEDFRKQIKDAVGWDVSMLAKEEEGRVGAMGIASSLPEVSGLVMDLGGGSTQLTWLTSTADGEVRMPESGAISMPYGAAAMSRRLNESEKQGTIEKLKAEVMKSVKEAYDSLQVPETMKQEANARGGFTMYLSGGGFRGWGYILMSRHPVQPYPIPIINGFKSSRENFMRIDDVKMSAVSSLENHKDQIFRVSDRRASQVPAVAFLVSAMAEALPQIKEVRFCQGGVREGYLFTSCDFEQRREHPLVVATQPFASKYPQNVLHLLQSAIPQKSSPNLRGSDLCPFGSDLLQAFGNLMWYHSSHSKDLQASAALRSTTSGILAGVHGVMHEDRAQLALLLCSRWGGDVPPTDDLFKTNLEKLMESPSLLWWINYIGAVASLVAGVFPAGISGPQEGHRVSFESTWSGGKHGKPILDLKVNLDAELNTDMFSKGLKEIEKVGKKKNWIGGKDGFGFKVVVETALHSA